MPHTSLHSQKYSLTASEDDSGSWRGSRSTLASSYPGVSRGFEDTTHLIPSPGYSGIPPEEYNPVFMNLFMIVGAPFVLFLLGIGLEISVGLSQSRNGFPVPLKMQLGVFGSISSQFLAAFIPPFLILPNAILWRLLDWMVRMYQPYIVLSEGNASAEQSILLNYIELGPILTIPRALKYKHRLVFISSFTAALTYLFQPFVGSVFQIRQVQHPSFWAATRLETLARAQDIGTLKAFVAGAGYADAATVHGFPDPKFISGSWATTKFTFPINSFIDATLSVKTVALNTFPNCSNPVTQGLASSGETFTLTTTSITSCSHTVSFDANNSALRYGVEAIPCPSANGVVDTEIDFQPIMFWFFHRRGDTGQPEAKAIFCAPKLSGSYVTVLSDVKSGNIMSINTEEGAVPDNDVLNGPQGGRAYNGVVFTPSTDPLIEARANAVKAILPGTMIRTMGEETGGLDAVFDRANGVLDLTSGIYERHLAVVAKGVYFVPANSSLPGTFRAYEPRLWVDPFPAHFLAAILSLTGLVGIVVHVLHRNQRKKIHLAAEPGTIAAATALTARSGFGSLLTPYDSESTIEKKLDGLKFGFDRRTGAIVVEDTAELSTGGRNSEYSSFHWRRSYPELPQEMRLSLLRPKSSATSETAF